MTLVQEQPPANATPSEKAMMTSFKWVCPHCGAATDVGRTYE